MARMVTALVGYHDSLIVEEHHHDVANLATLPTDLLNSPILLELAVKMANVSTDSLNTPTFLEWMAVTLATVVLIYFLNNSKI